VTGRDDDYGGDFAQRMNSSVNYLAKLCNETRFPIEYIIVEWNPLPNRMLVSKLAKTYQYLTVRIITVPRSVHVTTENYQKFPVQEYMAKNVGIRRARGEYVLSSNADVIFSRALVEYWSQQKLQRGRFYRMHLFYTETIHPCLQLHTYESFLRSRAWMVGGGLFSWGIIANDSQRATFWNLFDAKAQDCASDPEEVRSKREEMNAYAAGDFILMAKDQWVVIKGHPERGFTSSLDYLTQFHCMAFYEQTMLLPPLAIFHQSHDHEGARPQLEEGEVVRAGEWMIAKKTAAPAFANSELWGWANYTFDEVSL